MNGACLLFLPFYSDTGGPKHWTLLVLERFGDVKRDGKGAETAEGLEAAGAGADGTEETAAEAFAGCSSGKWIRCADCSSFVASEKAARKERERMSLWPLKHTLLSLVDGWTVTYYDSLATIHAGCLHKASRLA